MAKNQSRTPGRDVRGGKGKGGRPFRPTQGKGPRGEKNRPPASRPGAARREQRDRTDLIEGRRAVEEALACGMPLRSALVQERSGERDQVLEKIAARLDEVGVPVERVPRARGRSHDASVLEPVLDPAVRTGEVPAQDKS